MITTFLLAVLGVFDAHAQGLVWTANRTTTEGGWPPLASWEIAFDHVSDPSFPTPPPSLNPATRIFSMILTTNDTGRTFFANALNEPGFAGFAAGLTDGANGYIRLQAPYPSTWGGLSEQVFLGRSSLSPDLAGYNITQISFRVNNFYDSYYAPDDVYLKTLNYSFDFYGAPVPEPGIWALLSLGAAAGLFMRRRMRRQHPAPPR
jgi:hypothetical protein